MFGPNVSKKSSVTVNFHHREVSFMHLYKNVLDLFRSKFNISDDYEIIFFSGSGTLAVESFISHFKGKLSVHINADNEKFAKRWMTMATHYHTYNPKSPNKLYVQFETSQSKYNKKPGHAIFTDAISAFPFFPTPTTPAWATVSSKILGGLPVLGILVIKKDFLVKYMHDTPSYMNPHAYVRYQEKSQTPFTPAIPLFQDFYVSLKKLDVKKIRADIANNYRMLAQVIGEENIINPLVAPVITVKEGIIPDVVAKRWNLYGYTTKGKIQIFLYSEKKSAYRALARDIKKSLL